MSITYNTNVRFSGNNMIAPKTKYLSLLFSLLFGSLGSLAQQKDITFEHFSIQNGLSQNTIRAIVQDKKGFMWFGSEDGLNRFDGYSFKTYKSTEGVRSSLSDNLIYALFVDRDNTLWIGTNNGGLVKYKSDQDKFESFKNYYNQPDSAPINYVNSIVQDKNGFLWVGSYDGLAKFDTKKGVFVSVFNENSAPDSFIDNNIVCICLDKEDMVWIGTKYGGLFRLDPHTMEIKNYRLESLQPNLLNNKINCLTFDKSGMLWLGTANGLYRFNPSNERAERFYKDDKDSSSLSSNEITSVFQDSRGQIWISGHNGLNLYRPDTKNFYHYKSDPGSATSLSDNGIYSIFEDRYGQVWLGGETKGINKFNTRTKRFQHYFHQWGNKNSISGNTIRELYEDDENNLWIGIFGNGLDLLNRKTDKITHFKHEENNPNSIADDRVCAVLKDRKKNIWVGMWDGGLDKMVFKNGKYSITHYKHDPKNSKSLSNNVVQEIFEDKWGRIWIGSKQGIDLFDDEKNEFINFSKAKNNNNSLIHNSVQSGCIVQDQFGNLWIGSWGGLTMVKLSFETRMPIAFYQFKQDRRNRNSLSDNRVVSLHIDKHHHLWVGTFGGGANKLIFDKKGNINKVVHYTENNGLPNNEIFSIQEDAHENIWMSTNKGLAKLNPETEKFCNYDISDGLQSNQFYWGAGTSLKTHELAFGGINGINIFNPDSIKNDLSVPQTVLTGFKIFNEKIAVGPESKLKINITEVKQIELQYTDKVISFEFSVLHYASPEKNRYAYKLEGFDKQWIYTDSKNRIATYTNLDPGKYTFKVKGCSADGIWDEKGTSVNIVIRPPFWSTWWFRVMLVIILIGAGFAGNDFKIKRLKRQKKILEQRVAERTAELREANFLLKERQEEILQQNEEISQQSEELVQQRDALSEQNMFIKEQNKIITEKNEQIDASIRYALTIQQALLPPESLIKNKFDAFVLYLPKDIISGDFYWYTDLSQHENCASCLIAVADCTGHGVPGAFMSMLGINLLNEITTKNPSASPCEILEALDAGIKRTLRQDFTENQDGLEIILCKIEQKYEGHTEICFSGSKINMILFNAITERMEVFKSDRRIIGGLKHKVEEHVPFSNKIVSVQANDTIYLSTDGIIDQNNPERKRFGSRNLIASLYKGSGHCMDEQGKLLHSRIEHWKLSENQRDDITVLGIRF